MNVLARYTPRLMLIACVALAIGIEAALPQDRGVLSDLLRSRSTVADLDLHVSGGGHNQRNILEQLIREDERLRGRLLLQSGYFAWMLGHTEMRKSTPDLLHLCKVEAQANIVASQDPSWLVVVATPSEIGIYSRVRLNIAAYIDSVIDLAAIDATNRKGLSALEDVACTSAMLIDKLDSLVMLYPPPSPARQLGLGEAEPNDADPVGVVQAFPFGRAQVPKIRSVLDLSARGLSPAPLSESDLPDYGWFQAYKLTTSYVSLTNKKLKTDGINSCDFSPGIEFQAKRNASIRDECFAEVRYNAQSGLLKGDCSISLYGRDGYLSFDSDLCLGSFGENSGCTYDPSEVKPPYFSQPADTVRGREASGTQGDAIPALIRATALLNIASSEAIRRYQAAETLGRSSMEHHISYAHSVLVREKQALLTEEERQSRENADLRILADFLVQQERELSSLETRLVNVRSGQSKHASDVVSLRLAVKRGETALMQSAQVANDKIDAELICATCNGDEGSRNKRRYESSKSAGEAFGAWTHQLELASEMRESYFSARRLVLQDKMEIGLLESRILGLRLIVSAREVELTHRSEQLSRDSAALSVANSGAAADHAELVHAEDGFNDTVRDLSNVCMFP